jgi:hypothetical protein
MLTLDNVYKIFSENDESQIFLKPSKLDISTPYYFQVVSLELAIGFVVKVDGDENAKVYIPMQIESVKDYDARAIALKLLKKGGSPKEDIYSELCLSVWSEAHDCVRVLVLNGANIKRVLDILPRGEEGLKAKFGIIKSPGTPATYTVMRDPKKDVAPVRKIAKPMHLTNLFFKQSPFDPARKLEEFISLVM